MNRMSWLLVVPLALVSLMSLPVGCYELDTFSCPEGVCTSPASTTGTGGTGGMGASTSSTGPAMCMVDGDCMNDECRTNGKCMDGTCKWDFTAAMTPLASQVYGDCKEFQCDGMGNVTNANVEPKDSYVYSNKCYAPDCSQGASPKAAAMGTVCNTSWDKPGVCDDMANCIECTGTGGCMAPTPNCANGRCVAGTTCTDGVKNGTGPLAETDVDCGGPCPPCKENKTCLAPSDCESNKCPGGTCKPPACDDNFKNGDETDVDCGGSCATDPDHQCVDGKVCLLPTDCKSGKCMGGTCAATP